MKFVKYNLIAFVLIYSFSLQGQINRYDNFKHRNLDDINLPNTYTYKDVDKILSARYERAINNCYKTLVETCRESVINDEAEFDYIEPESSWIRILEFYKIEKTGFSGCLLMTGESYYFFKVDKNMWLRWKNAQSQGKFYNDYIRDNPKYSYRSFCKALMEINK